MKSKMIHIGDTIIRRDSVLGIHYKLYDPKDNCGVEMVNYIAIYIGGGSSVLPFGVNGMIEITGSYAEIKQKVNAFEKELG